MPKSLYSDNAKNLVLKDAVQVVTLTVSPLTGEMFTIDSENYIVAGSVSIDRYCTTGNDIELGSACASELKFKLYNQDKHFDDITFEGAEISVSVELKSVIEYERKSQSWDGTETKCVFAGFYSTDRIRVVFSEGNAVEGEFICSHFPYSAEYQQGEISVYRTNSGEVGLIGPIDTEYFGSVFTGDAETDKGIIDAWLQRQSEAGTPFTVVETFENEIPGTVIPLGYFTVDEAPRKTQTMTINALDRMAQFSKVFDTSTISFPCTVISLLRAICSKVNVPYNEDSTLENGETVIPACPNILEEMDYTYRDYLIWIGEITGTCSYINEHGALTLARYSNFDTITAQLTPDMRMEGSADLYEDDITVTGIRFTRKTGTKKQIGTDGKLLNIENNQLMNQLTSGSTVSSILTNIYNAGWGGLTYRPYSTTCKSVPYLWPLDKIKYETLDGDIVDTIITHATWVLNGNSKIQAKGVTATKSGYATSDYLTARERAVINALREEEKQERSNMEQAAIQLNSMILNGLGLYFTEVKDENGSKKIYAHNADTLETSQTIFTMNSSGFAWTNSGWDGDDTVWTSGLDKNGNAVLKAITAYHISADDVVTGVLRSENNQSYLNLNNGTFNFGNGLLTWNGTTLYVKGKVDATSGTIGGWDINSTSLSKTINNTYGDTVRLCPENISTTSSVIEITYGGMQIFYVNGCGKLFASGATVEGNITASSGSIGGWNINSDSLSYDGNGYGIGLYPERVNTSSNVISVWYDSSEKFRVTGQGKMIATDAEIAGQITATSGTIGGWDVDGNSLRYRNGTSITSSGVFFYPRNIATDNSVILVSYLGNNLFEVTGKGELYAKDAYIEGEIDATSGKIGGWDIASNELHIGLNTSDTYFGLNAENVGSSSYVIAVRAGGENKFILSGQGAVTCEDLKMRGGSIRLKSTANDTSFFHLSGATGNYVKTGAGGFSAVRSGYKMVYGYEPGGTTDGSTLRFYDDSSELQTVISYNGITSTPVYSHSNTGGKAVYLTSSGYFYSNSSSQRYKNSISEDIVDFVPENLLALHLKQYKYNQGYFTDNPECNEWFCGFIAEDVAELYPHAATYDGQGNVEMWDVYRIVPPILDLVQKLYKRVETLENKLLEVS